MDVYRLYCLDGARGSWPSWTRKSWEAHRLDLFRNPTFGAFIVCFLPPLRRSGCLDVDHDDARLLAGLNITIAVGNRG
jgi:hypothetical protein